MDNFMKNLKRTIGEEFNESVTENGAVGYHTTGKELLTSTLRYLLSATKRPNKSNADLRKHSLRINFSQ